MVGKNDFPKKGITDEEFRVREQLIELGIPFDIDFAICFECSGRFVISKGVYPNKCAKCGIVYTKEGQYCLPDFQIYHKNLPIRSGIIEVNGNVHDKVDRQKKDRIKIEKLQKLGYAVFVIHANLFKNLPNMLLRLLLWSMYLCLNNTALYDISIKGEKELFILTGKK